MGRIPLKFSEAKALEALAHFRSERGDGVELGLLDEAEQARAVAAEALLRQAIGSYAEVTCWGEAAALLLTIAADAKKKSGKFERGRPKKSNIIEKYKIHTTAFEIYKHKPTLSYAEALDVLVYGLQNGHLSLEGVLPTSHASYATLRKRVVRALGSAKRLYRRKT